MYKIILFVTFLVLYVESKPETLLDELIERVVEKNLMNDNLDDKCDDAGIRCYSKDECSDCGQAGRCIKGPTDVKCMCWWGWTGPNARRADYGNHILADSCDKACHYTHDSWNSDCLKCQGCPGCPHCNPQCDEYDCNKIHGRCINDNCVCDDSKCGYVGGMCDNGECKTCNNCGHGKCIKGVCHKKYNLIHDNLDDKCNDAGIQCYPKGECSDCGQAGRCIKGTTDVKCMCWWGWTGPNARRAKYGNHILADSCGKPCHYNHDFWNPKCLKCPGCGSNQCDEDDCNKMHGRCINDKCVCDDTKCGYVGGMCDNGECKKCNNCGHGKCIKGVCHIKCCRDITPFGSPFNGGQGQFKKHCEDRCKWVEEMPGACTPTPMEPCNPKCALSGGQCDTNTGRCKCCKDFTGPGAMLVGDDIYAHYCDVFCSSKILCVNEDYVKRMTARKLKSKITK